MVLVSQYVYLTYVASQISVEGPPLTSPMVALLHAFSHNCRLHTHCLCIARTHAHIVYAIVIMEFAHAHIVYAFGAHAVPKTILDIFCRLTCLYTFSNPT